LLEMSEMRPLYALLPHPNIAGVEAQVVARRAGAEYHHAAALHDQAGDRERRLAGMLEHDIDVALAGDVPDRLAKPARFLDPAVVCGGTYLRHRAPAGKLLAVDGALGAQLHHVIALALVRDDADRIGPRGRRKLHAEDAETARGAPDQHMIARFHGVGRMTEQHPIGGRKRQRITGRLLPAQVWRLGHELA